MEKDTLSRSRPLAGLPTKELITALKKAGSDDLDTPHHSEFYSRFRDRFYKICHVVCTRRRLADLTDDIFMDTFISAFRSLAKFKFDTSANDAEVGNKVLAFLGKIAERRLLDHLKKRIKGYQAEKETAREEALDDQVDDLELVENGSLQQQVLQEALDSLSDEQRYILMVYMDFGALKINRPAEYSLGDSDISADDVSFRKIPSPERKRLCEQLGITEGNLRVLKSRAIKKVIKYIKEHV